YLIDVEYKGSSGQVGGLVVIGDLIQSRLNAVVGFDELSHFSRNLHRRQTCASRERSIGDGDIQDALAEYKSNASDSPRLKCCKFEWRVWVAGYWRSLTERQQNH